MQLIKIIFQKFVNRCENEIGNTLFDKMNENGLLIALESRNSVLNFDEKSASAATGNGSGGLRFNVSD